VSQIILQQTRVQQGISYFIIFVESFPYVRNLAEAKESKEGKVLHLWQALGYYSRVRNMHYAAKAVLEKYKGVFPSDYAFL